ncbi:MAG: hypothetical protein V1723_04780 [Candidatus Uhrbacteria bacterium]
MIQVQYFRLLIGLWWCVCDSFCLCAMFCLDFLEVLLLPGTQFAVEFFLFLAGVVPFSCFVGKSSLAGNITIL